MTSSPKDEQLLAQLLEEDQASKETTLHEAAVRRGYVRTVRQFSEDARHQYADLLDRLGR